MGERSRFVLPEDRNKTGTVVVRRSEIGIVEQQQRAVKRARRSKLKEMQEGPVKHPIVTLHKESGVLSVLGWLLSTNTSPKQLLFITKLIISDGCSEGD